MRKLDEFVPKSRPLRLIRVMANEALAQMDQLFAQMSESTSIVSESTRIAFMRVKVSSEMASG